jgi:hypothetical protein
LRAYSEEGELEYCLDSNVYIQAHRTYYSFEFLPPFWKWLADLANAKIICSPIAVRDELIPSQRDKYDELADWAKEIEDVLFVDPDNQVVTAYQSIVDYVNENYEPHHSREFLGMADPWVIAQSLATGLVVVSMENYKNEERKGRTGYIQGRVKIPNVCNNFKVECINIFTMMRKLGAKFG